MVQSGRSATFYVTKPQFDAIMSWYWTPERRKQRNVEQVSPEVQKRIESELGIKGAQFFYSNRVTCEKCGYVNGAFEFVQQGIREHGREIVETALTLANACVVRVNPSTVTVCHNCRETWPIAHEYECGQYGCCFIEIR